MSAPDGVAELERKLGYGFADPQRLRQALTHRSWGRELGHELAPDASSAVPNASAAPGDNERFEFLGDAVLGLRVSERLLIAYPQSSEGDLSRLRSWLVSARNLARVAAHLDLGAHLRLSRAEDSIGGRTKQRLLANALEAVIAAIHLDGGYIAAAAFVDREILGTSLEKLTPAYLHEFAYKSALQEWAHAHARALPVYRVVAASGPEHGKTFTIELTLPQVLQTSASAKSKKDAEQKAAAKALVQLGLLPESPAL